MIEQTTMATYLLTPLLSYRIHFFHFFYFNEHINFFSHNLTYLYNFFSVYYIFLEETKLYQFFISFIIAILHRTTVDIGQIKIQSVATCLFLCMDQCGIVYGSVSDM